jgi:2-hydroxy fatty acid dioxygenase
LAKSLQDQATNSPTLIPLPDWLTIPNLPLNLGTIGAILYGGFYILLEPVAGSILLPIIIGWTAYANHLTTTMPSTINKVAIGVQVVTWGAQFIGHGVFEGRAPALLDNLLQALVLAPFFVFMEALFHFGYRPELQKRVNDAVEKEIKKVNAEKEQKKTNGSTKNGKAK